MDTKDRQLESRNAMASDDHAKVTPAARAAVRVLRAGRAAPRASVPLHSTVRSHEFGPVARDPVVGERRAAPEIDRLLAKRSLRGRRR